MKDIYEKIEFRSKPSRTTSPDWGIKQSGVSMFTTTRRYFFETQKDLTTLIVHCDTILHDYLQSLQSSSHNSAYWCQWCFLVSSCGFGLDWSSKVPLSLCGKHMHRQILLAYTVYVSLLVDYLLVTTWWVIWVFLQKQFKMLHSSLKNRWKFLVHCL